MICNEKRFYRILKREIKQDGNRNRRNYLKRALKDHPEEAHWDEYDFSHDSSAYLNGKYLDNKRYEHNNRENEEQNELYN